MPGTIRLDASANFDDAGMTATTLPHFNGADWTRHIFWQRGSYFAVIDTARFLEDSDYDLTCTWSSLPIARLEDGVPLTQPFEMNPVTFQDLKLTLRCLKCMMTEMTVKLKNDGMSAQA